MDDSWKTRLSIIFKIDNNNIKPIIEKALLTFPHITFYGVGKPMNFEFSNYIYIPKNEEESIFNKSSILFSQTKDSYEMKAKLSGLDVVSGENKLIFAIVNWNNENSLHRIDNFEKAKKTLENLK